MLEPWDRNPLLERLEANRVGQIASRHIQGIKASRAFEEQQEWARGQAERLRGSTSSSGLRRLGCVSSGSFLFARELARDRRRGGALARAPRIEAHDLARGDQAGARGPDGDASSRAATRRRRLPLAEFGDCNRTAIRAWRP